MSARLIVRIVDLYRAGEKLDRIAAETGVSRAEVLETVYRAGVRPIRVRGGGPRPKEKT